MRGRGFEERKTERESLRLWFYWTLGLDSRRWQKAKRCREEEREYLRVRPTAHGTQ
jgi:hypothetical protein